MSNQNIIFEKKTNVATITLNRENHCHAINENMLEEFNHYLDIIENDNDIRLLIITATGNKFFCSGGDIKSWSKYSPLDMGRKWIKKGNVIFDRLRNLPIFTIALLNGHAIGGGLELALSCDIRIAYLNVKLSTPEVTLNMIPGWMGIERLVSLVGTARCKEMLLLGQVITAEEAHKIGLVNLIINPENKETTISEYSKKVQKTGPSAMSHIKQLISHIDNKNTELNHQLLAALMSATQDCQEATAAFIEKRKPTFSNN